MLLTYEFGAPVDVARSLLRLFSVSVKAKHQLQRIYSTAAETNGAC